MLLLPAHRCLRLLRHSLILGCPLLLSLQDSLDFVAALLKHRVHLNCEWVLLSHHLMSEISSLLIGAQTALILLQVFIFDSNIVQSDNHHCLSALHLLLPPVNLQKLVLDEDQRLHGVMQGHLMFAELTEDGTDVQVDFAGVTDQES